MPVWLQWLWWGLIQPLPVAIILAWNAYTAFQAKTWGRCVITGLMAVALFGYEFFGGMAAAGTYLGPLPEVWPIFTIG